MFSNTSPQTSVNSDCSNLTSCAARLNELPKNLYLYVISNGQEDIWPGNIVLGSRIASTPLCTVFASLNAAKTSQLDSHHLLSRPLTASLGI